jgi:hypothetical protein
MEEQMKSASPSQKTGRSLPLFLCALVIAGLLAAPSAFAVEFAAFGGTEIDEHGQGFTYAAFSVTQPIDKVFAVTGRVMPSYLTYKYYSGDRLIKAESPGVAVMGGVRILFNPKVALTLLGGVDVRNTTLHPDDRTADVRGSTTAGLVQGELDAWLTKYLNFFAVANYSGTSDFFYEKAILKHQITNMDLKEPYSFYLGVEQFYGRNRDFRQNGAGPMIQYVYIPLNFAMSISGGYKHDSTFGQGTYVGFQIYKGF